MINRPRVWRGPGLLRKNRLNHGEYVYAVGGFGVVVYRIRANGELECIDVWYY